MSQTSSSRRSSNPTHVSIHSQELHKRAEARLRHSGYLALRDVTCEADQGVVILRGKVRSHYLKQVAQALAHGVEGVRGLVNQIEVLQHDNREIGRDQ